jgi:hypothetical protein
MAIARDEFSPDDDELVDVFQILPDFILVQPGIAAANGQVSAGSELDPLGKLIWKVNLSIVPRDFNLGSTSAATGHWQTDKAPSPLLSSG